MIENTDMDKKELCYSSLDAVLIVKDFVKGDKNCNYENYLLELINESKYFSNKFNGKPFVKPFKEDNGECDCYCGDYGLDFKLVLSQTYIQAKRELSFQKIILKNGIATCSPRRQNKSMSVSKLHVALRNSSLNYLNDIEQGNFKYGTVEYDLQAYLNLLETNKNLFLFVPLQFYYKDRISDEEAILEINNAVVKDYEISIAYRKQYVKDKDTYLALVYNESLLIYENIGDKFIFNESIDLHKSETYSELEFTYIF
jgi:hypothetical protein